jgi:hypothetical protein
MPDRPPAESTNSADEVATSSGNSVAGDQDPSSLFEGGSSFRGSVQAGRDSVLMSCLKKQWVLLIILMQPLPLH